MPDNEICLQVMQGVGAPLLCASVGLRDEAGDAVTDPARRASAARVLHRDAPAVLTTRVPAPSCAAFGIKGSDSCPSRAVFRRMRLVAERIAGKRREGDEGKAARGWR